MKWQKEEGAERKVRKEKMKRKEKCLRKTSENRQGKRVITID